MAENIRPYIIINGKSSRDVSGLLIVSLPPITKPQMRVSAEEINGRDGDIVTELGFSAYDKPVEIGLAGDYDINEVISYFNQAGIITFSNEPDKYYRFAQYNGIDFEKLIRFKTATVIFHCQPFKYSKDENDAVFWNPENITIENAGNIYSKPQLAIQGSGNVGITLNGSEVLSIAFGETQQAIIIDSDKMNAYGTKSNIKSLVVDINPVQDLHGYDYPWTAGCGKNKFKVTATTQTINGVTFTVNDDGTILVNGTATADARLTLGSYVAKAHSSQRLNGLPDSVTTNDVLLGYQGYGTVNLNSRVCVINRNVDTDWNNDVYITVKEGTTVSNLTFKPMIFLSTESDSTFAPYENICSITGWDEVNVTHTSGEMSAPVSLDFGQTVYKGTIDLTTGLLRIIHNGVKIRDIDWGYFATYKYFQAPISAIKRNTNVDGILEGLMCEGYANRTPKQAGSGDIDGSIAGINDAIRIKNLAYDNPTDFVNAMGDYLIVYPLETPIEIQLTAQEIEALVGTNVIYADTGAISELIYTKDGAEITTSGEIVTFDVDASDLRDDILKNRLVTGNYDNLRLKAGSNQIGITGDVDVLVFSNFSRWL